MPPLQGVISFYLGCVDILFLFAFDLLFGLWLQNCKMIDFYYGCIGIHSQNIINLGYGYVQIRSQNIMNLCYGYGRIRSQNIIY